MVLPTFIDIGPTKNWETLAHGDMMFHNIFKKENWVTSDHYKHVEITNYYYFQKKSVTTHEDTMIS